MKVLSFRKKPVVIEAVHYADGWDCMEIADWCHGECSGFGELYIGTLEGQMTATPGDWIIKGVAGEFYPCKPDIFAATYEAAQ